MIISTGMSYYNKIKFSTQKLGYDSENRFSAQGVNFVVRVV